MQIYIVGIGQCGTSIAFDVISRLTGFVKSKAVTSSPHTGGSEAASNELLKRLNNESSSFDKVRAIVASWAGRFLRGGTHRRVFVIPRIAIIDGNPDNFVKDAFQKFRGGVVASDDSDNDDIMRRHLVDLIRTTEVLGFGDWNNGCANGIVGETITSIKLPKDQFRKLLHIDGKGRRLGDNGILLPEEAYLPVSIYLVVSSAGGGTGSGGGIHLGQSDALVDHGPNSPLVLNTVVLPSIGSSMNNPVYALNAGRAMARHAKIITVKDQGEDKNSSAVVLFSNPSDEGDNRALQTLNNYIAEFSIRLANFTFAGNVARIARDVDPRELASFFKGKVSALGMSYLAHGDWDDGDVEKLMVERAFGNIYDDKNIGNTVETPQGLSIERTIEVCASGKKSKKNNVLFGTTYAIMVLGLPPNFHRRLDLNKIGKYVRDFSGSSLPVGIRSFSYGSAKDLEFTVFLRYKRLDACPLAQYFVERYIDQDLELGAGSGEMTEIRYLENRALQDDDYAEVFEGIVSNLKDLEELTGFDGYVLNNPRRKTVERGPDSNVVEGEAP